MTPLEAMMRECEEITSRTGHYVPQYRLNGFMKTAQKITDLIVNSDLCISYEDCTFILRIVLAAIETATGKEAKK